VRLVIFQDKCVFSQMNEKLSRRPFDFYDNVGVSFFFSHLKQVRTPHSRCFVSVNSLPPKKVASSFAAAERSGRRARNKAPAKERWQCNAQGSSLNPGQPNQGCVFYPK